MKASLMATPAALAVAWLAWVAAGWAAEAVGLDDLDLVVPVAAVFLALTVVERALQRFVHH